MREILIEFHDELSSEFRQHLQNMTARDKDVKYVENLTENDLINVKKPAEIETISHSIFRLNNSIQSLMVIEQKQSWSAQAILAKKETLIRRRLEEKRGREVCTSRDRIELFNRKHESLTVISQITEIDFFFLFLLFRGGKLSENSYIFPKLYESLDNCSLCLF